MDIIQGENAKPAGENQEAIPPSGPTSVSAESTIKANLDLVIRCVIQVARPMVDLSMLVLDNVHVLERQLEILVSQNIEKLKEKLYVPIIDLELEQLKHPATVCTDTACAEAYQLESGRKEWHYKTRCHQPCHLRNVPHEVIGSAELRVCAVMSPAGTCNGCGHSYKSHMHVYYVTKLIETSQTDPVVLQNLQTHEQILDYSKKIVQEIEKRKRQLHIELDALVKSNAVFSNFLSHESTNPTDVYETYIRCLMDRERSLDAQGDAQKLVQLQRLLDEHINTKNDLLKDERGGEHNLTTILENIMYRIDELYQLSLSGPKIKQLFHLQVRDLKLKPKLAKAPSKDALKLGEANSMASETKTLIIVDTIKQTNKTLNGDANPSDFLIVGDKVDLKGKEHTDSNSKYCGPKCPFMSLIYWWSPRINIMAIILFLCLSTYLSMQLVLAACLLLLNLCMVISVNETCKTQLSRLCLDHQIKRTSQLVTTHSNIFAKRLLNIFTVKSLPDSLKFNTVLWMLLISNYLYSGTSLLTAFFGVLFIVPVLCEWVHVNLRYVKTHFNTPEVFKRLKRHVDSLMALLMDY